MPAKIKPEDIIKKAESYLLKRDFSTLAYYLTAKVPLFGENAQLYYYLGLAQMYLNNLTAAKDYFAKGMSCAPEHVDLKLAAALVALRQRDTSHAVQFWLEVLDIDPTNKKAQRGLNMLRKVQTPNEIARFLWKGGSKKLEPALPSRRIFLRVAIALFACAALLAILWCGMRFLPSHSGPLAGRIGAEKYNIPLLKKQNYVQESPDQAIFHWTPEQIRVLMTQAKEDFIHHKDNKVRLALNKIRYSNASDAIRAKASILQETLDVPNFTNLDTNFAYRDVFANPVAHNGVYVNWRGKVQNIQFTDKSITCSLLVGYDTEKVLEGEVLVYVPFETFIDPLLPTEILGQIMVDEDQHFSLYATSIHQILSAR